MKPRLNSEKMAEAVIAFNNTLNELLPVKDPFTRPSPEEKAEQVSAIFGGMVSLGLRLRGVLHQVPHPVLVHIFTDMAADVSTNYLNDQSIRELVEGLLEKNPDFAAKFKASREGRSNG